MKRSLILLLLIGLGLTACSFFSNRDKIYLKTTSIPPLKIPPGVSSSSFHNYYPVPERTYPASAKEVSIVPPGLYDKT